MKKTIRLFPALPQSHIAFDVNLGDDEKLKERGHIAVEHLSREEAEEFAEVIKNTFFENWQRLQLNRKK